MINSQQQQPPMTLSALREARDLCETRVVPFYADRPGGDLLRALLKCDLQDADRALIEQDLVRGSDTLTRLREWLVKFNQAEQGDSI